MKIQPKDIEVTPELVSRWRTDFPAFCKEALHIIDKDNNLVPFRLNRFQRKLWDIVKEDIDAGRPCRLYLLKARQLGSSTFVQALIFWRTVLWHYSAGLVVAHALKPAEELFRKSQIFYSMLPPQLRPERKRGNTREMHFAREDKEGIDMGLQSKISVETVRDVHIGASQTLHAVHLSEFARYESVQANVKLSLATLLQTVPKKANTFVIIETTAWGMNYSYRLWNAELSEGENWKRVFVSWVADGNYTTDEPLPEDDLESAEETRWGNEAALLPLIERELVYWYPESRYDKKPEELRREALCRLAWRRGKIAVDLFNDLQLFRQEYPTTAEEAFLTSGTNVFDTRRLADYAHAIQTDERKPRKLRFNADTKLFKDAKYGDLTMYEPPKDGKRYVIGADVSEGLLSGDYSVAQVLSLPELEQVAVYCGQLDPAAYANALSALGKLYNTAYIGVEVNGPGFATNLWLHQELHYPSLYRRQQLDARTRKYQNRYGWNTNKQSKTVIISNLRDAIRTDLIQLRDHQTILELGQYVQDENTGKLSAATGFHDDHVMSLAIGLQMVEEWTGLPASEKSRPKRGAKGTLDYHFHQLDRKHRARY